MSKGFELVKFNAQNLRMPHSSAAVCVSNKVAKRKPKSRCNVMMSSDPACHVTDIPSACEAAFVRTLQHRQPLAAASVGLQLEKEVKEKRLN
jgi:hypothetical protein